MCTRPRRPGTREVAYWAGSAVAATLVAVLHFLVRAGDEGWMTDLRVYLDGAHLSGSALYTTPLGPFGLLFQYPPVAADLFALLPRDTPDAVAVGWNAASLLALQAAVWSCLRLAGVGPRARAVAALAAAPFLIRGLIDRSSVGKQPAASVTAAPEETAEPTPTPEPTPLQFTTVDTSYFDDALFIGDSRTVGIAEYGSLKNATYFADVGLNVYVAQTKAIAVKNVGTVTLPQLLSQKTFGKVYIMLGINELGNDLDDITAKFSSLIDTVRAAQPDAIIFVEANLHVGPSRSSTDATFNNPRIDKLNEKLAALADGKTIFYIDINELFDDENGNLRADASGDSTHVYAKYDLDWCDWLCTKAIVR